MKLISGRRFITHTDLLSFSGSTLLSIGDIVKLTLSGTVYCIFHTEKDSKTIYLYRESIHKFLKECEAAGHPLTKIFK